MELILENVRSFCGRHVIPTRPLTLLIGENSTGKTTFLAMLSIASSPWFPAKASLSDPPYELGSFDTVATNRGGKRGTLRSFTIGYAFNPPEYSSHRSLITTFSDNHGQPSITSLYGRTKKIELNCSLSASTLTGTIRLSAEEKETQSEYHHTFEADIKEDLQHNIPIIFTLATKIVGTLKIKEGDNVRNEIGNAVWELLGPQGPHSAIVSLAPVRTKPKRTYDEVSRDFRPEGDHIPVVLARLWEDEATAQKKAFYDALVQFGKDSGLLTDLDVKKLGRKSSSPFQIMVKTGGPSRNLQDVGYGVSQVLPIFGDSILTPKGTQLLLQQPEVHLHPRGQAALGTLFAKLVASKHKRFVIETHSDYLLDRIRLEVARGTIASDLVQILFFEKKKIETKVHQLSLDEQGNLTNAPPSYSSFFLNERNDLLFRSK